MPPKQIEPVSLPPQVALNLALAVIESSNEPMMLLDASGVIIGISDSFIVAFKLAPGDFVGQSIYGLGGGEWDLPPLRSLVGAAAIALASTKLPAYEIDVEVPGLGTRRLIINAHRLVYDLANVDRILLAASDVTDARAAQRKKDDLIAEKLMLMKELQHRVANSLQIIASVLMTSARTVSSEETRRHLRDAHGRVMAIAELQTHLAETDAPDVDLGVYFTGLCRSLAASMIEDPSRVALVANADGSRVSANTSVSLGLIVTELVINSLKHGFAGGRSGCVVVDYTATGDAWVLRVTDDGVGMPDGKAATPGLGTSIVSALARHLNAIITTVPVATGTRVVVSSMTKAERIASDAAEPAV